MFKRKLKATILGGVFLISSALASTALAATEWTAVSVWPQNNYHVKSLQAFAEQVKKVTNGQVSINVHFGGDLGLKGPALLGAVRDHIVDVADILLPQQVGEEPLFELEAVPYLARNFKELAQLEKAARPYYEKVAARNNQKFLYLAPWPGQGVFSKKPTDTLAGFKGLKIRTVDRSGTDFFKALGATPIQMPWGEVIPALASGAIDAVSTSSPSGVDGKIWEFAGYYNQLNWQSGMQAVSVNLDAWKKLTPENQKAIAELAQRMEPGFWQVAGKADETSLAAFRAHGMKVAPPSEALAADLTREAAPLWKAFSKRVGNDAVEIIAKYREISGR